MNSTATGNGLGGAARGSDGLRAVPAPCRVPPTASYYCEKENELQKHYIIGSNHRNKYKTSRRRHCTFSAHFTNFRTKKQLFSTYCINISWIRLCWQCVSKDRLVKLSSMLSHHFLSHDHAKKRMKKGRDKILKGQPCVRLTPEPSELAVEARERCDDCAWRVDSASTWAVAELRMPGCSFHSWGSGLGVLSFLVLGIRRSWSLTVDAPSRAISRQR